jgi:serine/threonine protein phosphatase PrpC
MGTYREAALWGDEHTELGEIAVASLAPNAALALSRGKFPKGYPHLDPNEDAVLAATDGAGWLLAAADGHNGFDAARAAVTAARRTAPAILAEAATDPAAALQSALAVIGQAVTEAVAGAPDGRAGSATALTLALLEADRLTAVTLGDTAALLVRGGRARRIGMPTRFLAPGADLTGTVIDQADLQTGDLVVVASDGLLDFLGRSPTRVLARLAAQHPDDPVDLARAAIERAFGGGAGDNIALVLFYAAPQMG